jgi:predicted nucleic acid-binding protein
MPSSDFSVRSTVGLILDATALIDFCWLGEWEWLQQQYSPLFIAQEVLDSDRLEEATHEAAIQYLEPIALDTEEMFLSFMEFQLKAPLLSEADRSTLALARHRFLLCLSDDSRMITVCEEYSIAYIRMLRLLSQMVQTGHRTVEEAIAMADTLVNERGKWIAPAILESWKRSLIPSCGQT